MSHPVCAGRSLRRLIRFLTAAGVILSLLFALSAGALTWPEELTDGQAAVRDYLGEINSVLASQGEKPFNSLFECWPRLIVAGITGEENAETPEAVELTVYLDENGAQYCELRVTELARFPLLAGAMIWVAEGESGTLAEAMRDPQAYLTRIQKQSDRSFADAVDTQQGESPRVYFGYDPNPYHYDLTLQSTTTPQVTMTLVFPRGGIAAGVQVTPVPEQDDGERRRVEDESDDFVGYYQQLGEGEYFEIFVTPTPEPDSAVYGY